MITGWPCTRQGEVGLPLLSAVFLSAQRGLVVPFQSHEDPHPNSNAAPRPTTASDSPTSPPMRQTAPLPACELRVGSGHRGPQGFPRGLSYLSGDPSRLSSRSSGRPVHDRCLDSGQRHLSVRAPSENGRTDRLTLADDEPGMGVDDDFLAFTGA